MSQAAILAGVSLRLSTQDGGVVVLRRARPPFEGTWAFPGGGVEDGDRRLAQGLDLPAPLGPARVAAVREALEELGLLIGVHGPQVPPADLAVWRGRLVAGEVGLEAALAGLGQTLDPEAGVPLGAVRLGTPLPAAWHLEVLRFELPPGATLVPDTAEVAEVRVAPPAELVSGWRSGRLPLAPGMTGQLEATAPDRAGFEPVFGVWGVPLRTPTLPPAEHTNVYVLGTGSHRVVVDPGAVEVGEQARLDTLLDAEGVRSLTVVLTHHHPDHVGGAAHLKARWGARVLAHPATRARLPAGLVDEGLADGPLPPLDGPRPTRWEARHTPGHAPGHLCLLEPETGTLLVGDLMAGVGTVVLDPPEGDLAAYLASLATVEALGPRLALPAHGPPIGDPVARAAAYRAHRLERESAILGALAAGAETPAAVVPEVYRDVPSALHPLAARSVLAHLLKLEREGRVVRSPDDRWHQAAPASG